MRGKPSDFITFIGGSSSNDLKFSEKRLMSLEIHE